MIETVETIKRHLQRCNSELCETVLKNAFVRASHFENAKKALQKGDQKSAERHIRTAKEIIESDIDRLTVGRLPTQLQTVLRYERDLDRQVEELLQKRRLPGVEFNH